MSLPIKKKRSQYSDNGATMWGSVTSAASSITT